MSAKALRTFVLTAVLSLIAASAQAGLRDGLVLHYSFDTNNGSTVLDESGQNRTGAVNGPVYTPNGRFNGAYQFNGAMNHILIGNMGVFPTGTISFWMNADVVENWRNTFSTNYAGWDDNIRFEETSTGEFYGGGLGLGRGDTFMRNMEANRWYHIVYVWDASYVYGYLDGKLIFQNSHPDPNSNILGKTAGEYKGRTLTFKNVAIGNGYSWDENRHWKGRIDEVRMYNRPLNAEEARQLYEGRGDDLVLHYSFDTNNGATAVDQSGWGHNASVSGAIFGNWGKINNTYYFDGVDDSITVPSFSSFKLGGEITVALWYQADDLQERPILSWVSGTSKGVHILSGSKIAAWNNKGTGVNFVDTSLASHIVSAPDPTGGQWHHLAVTYSQTTQEGALYIDGLPVQKLNLGSFTPLTAGSLYLGRDPVSGKSFLGNLDDVRIYKKALSPAEIRAVHDAYTHGKIYQNFEPNNGTGVATDYGWPINSTTVVQTTAKKHAGTHAWRVIVPSGTSTWFGGTGIKAQSDAWNVKLKPETHDRLSFWVWSQPSVSQALPVRVKFFDHNNYVWDPAQSKDGFLAQTQQQAKAGAWTQMSVYLSQLPGNFDFTSLDKMEFYFQTPGTYYIDDIEITSADRVYQNFEARPGVTTPNPQEYGAAWNGTAALTTATPVEGVRSWQLTGTNVLPNWAGTLLKYQRKDFGLDGNPNDIWNFPLVPPAINPPLYKQLTFFLKQTGSNRLANNVEVGLFDNGSYTGGYKQWSVQRSDYSNWARLSVPLTSLPSNFKLDIFNKIEMATYWPGKYSFDDVRVIKYPVPVIDEDKLPNGIISWPHVHGAVNYALQRSTAGPQGPWTEVYSGAANVFQTNSFTPAWFRVNWRSDSNAARGAVAYTSDWSETVYYEPKPVLLEKYKLNTGKLYWTFVPQADIYEIEEGATRFGPWTRIYMGRYYQDGGAPVNATLGKWYRARAIQQDGAGNTIATGPYSPVLLNDPQAFVTAQGLGLREKATTGGWLKLSGVNLGNYLLIEPWMLFGDNATLKTAYPDDWTFRQAFINRSGIGLAGWTAFQQEYTRAYIKESDLDNLMRLGINFVRLPFLAYDIRPFNDAGDWTGASYNFDALDRIIKLCADRGMYVLLDMHGAPGGQSTEFHTGRKNWNRLFDPATDVFRQRTVELWKEIALRYRDNPSVLGYDVLNEPGGALTPSYYSTPAAGYAALWSLYDRIYDVIRNPEPAGAADAKHLIVFEGIPQPKDWDSLPNPATYAWKNVMYQLHYYGFTFGERGETNGIMTLAEHKAYLTDKIANSKQNAYKVPVLIGEFNGFNDAAIWDYLVDTFNTKGWNWSPWSYKTHDKTTEWGLYVHTFYDEAEPNPQTDSLAALLRKAGKYASPLYHRSNSSLTSLIRTKAKRPGMIVDLKATAGAGQMTLTWSAPYTASPATSYVVRYGTVASGQTAFTHQDDAVPGATITGLTPGTVYYFRVYAVTPEGNGPYSNVVNSQPQ